MLFRALACDYDGTLATGDLIGPGAMAALRQAREAGLRLLLVTGRTFFELTRVCEPLDLFDAVVAENGGVVYYPREGTIQDQAPPPPPRLLTELERRGVYYQLGRVIVGTPRGDEHLVREAMASAGVTLDVVHNRAALMLLPVGLSKGSGVRQVLATLGLSFHDVLALGDAENDLDLFEACGWAGCPDNGVPVLRERADWVFPGDDGEGIARAIAERILPGALTLAGSPRHRVLVGWGVGMSGTVTIPERGVNLLVQGDPFSGKSWLAGALVERLHARHYAICVIDPEGDYRVLTRLPGVRWVEVDGRPAIERCLRDFEHDPTALVVADLSGLAHPDRVLATEAALGAIRRLRARTGLPHWVLIDEAHYFLHESGVAEESLGLEDKGFCLATYKSSWLRPSVARDLDVLILSRTTGAEELAFLGERLAGLEGGGAKVVAALPDIPLGEFIAVETGTAGASPGALSFAATPRETPHVRHLKKYADTRVDPDRRFFFRRADGRVVATADSLGEFRQLVADGVEDGVLDRHARRGDFSLWVRHVFSDLELAGQIHKVERRWTRGEIDDLRRALVVPIALRYGEYADAGP